MIKEPTGFDARVDSLAAVAVERFKVFAPRDGSPYIGCFSGGKDSVVIKELARLSGVPIEWVYNVTSVDPPELVRFIRREHPDVRFSRPPISTSAGRRPARRAWIGGRRGRTCGAGGSSRRATLDARGDGERAPSGETFWFPQEWVPEPFVIKRAPVFVADEEKKLVKVFRPRRIGVRVKDFSLPMRPEHPLFEEFVREALERCMSWYRGLLEATPPSTRVRVWFYSLGEWSMIGPMVGVEAVSVVATVAYHAEVERGPEQVRDR